MSFRQRLIGFLIAIVIVPMVIVSLVLFQIVGDNESGKAEARLGASQQVARSAFRQARVDAARAAIAIANDRRLAAAIQSGDRDGATEHAQRLLAARGARRIVLMTADGRRFVSVGDDDATAPATTSLRRVDGVAAGMLQVSVVSARWFASNTSSLAGGDLVLVDDGKILATSIAGLTAPPGAQPHRLSVRGTEYRVRSFTAEGFEGKSVRIVTLLATGTEVRAASRARSITAAILLGFLALALLFAFLVSRSLHQQIFRVLGAARRLGDGDLDARVETVGRDEFAQLGDEFNKMAEQMQTRVAELQTERERVQGSMRRLGRAVGSNLDADALLQLVVETAVDGVNADAGRVIVRDADGNLHEAARAGSGTIVRDTVRQAEGRALRQRRAASVATADAVALAHPLRVQGGDLSVEVNGVIAVGRAGRPFSPAESELFEYLAAQAAVSVENVGRHETVSRQSVTDPLTRLANRRRFDASLTSETERASRLGHPLGLILLDLDDFKAINDQYGHQQGDLVLVEVARTLRRACRDIDLPARYGGEELAVIVPGATLDGAYELAERVRRAVAELRVTSLDETEALSVTASFGVSSLPATATDGVALLAGADAALYRAKGAGKNRVERATATGTASAE